MRTDNALKGGDGEKAAMASPGTEEEGETTGTGRKRRAAMTSPGIEEEGETTEVGE